MTNEQILIKAVEKAIENGFDLKKFFPLYFIKGGRKPYPAEGILHNHDFAKAIWGERRKLTINR